MYFVMINKEEGYAEAGELEFSGDLDAIYYV